MCWTLWSNRCSFLYYYNDLIFSVRAWKLSWFGSRQFGFTSYLQAYSKYIISSCPKIHFISYNLSKNFGIPSALEAVFHQATSPYSKVIFVSRFINQYLFICCFISIQITVHHRGLPLATLTKKKAFSNIKWKQNALKLHPSAEEKKFATNN